MGNRRDGSGKRKVNFLEAHSVAGPMAPPPAGRDLMAIPAKLRKLMNLRSAIARGGRGTNLQPDQRNTKGNGGKPSRHSANAIGSTLHPDTKSTNLGRSVGVTSDVSDHPPGKRRVSLADKCQTLEARLKPRLGLDEKMKGFVTGVGERRKSFLREKKKKKNKGNNRVGVVGPELYQHDKVEFGEVVVAPPRLSFPKRAVQLKKSAEEARSLTMSNSRLRITALESHPQLELSSSTSTGQRFNSSIQE